MLESIPEDHVEDLHELAITNAKLIENLVERVTFLERQVIRNEYGYTEEQANAVAMAMHTARGGGQSTLKYIPWDFSSYLDDFLLLQRKMRQIEFAMPLDQKAAFPDLNDNPHSEDVKDDFTGL